MDVETLIAILIIILLWIPIEVLFLIQFDLLGMIIALAFQIFLAVFTVCILKNAPRIRASTPQL